MKTGIISAVLSSVVWGGGQFCLCRKRKKGLVLFLIQVVVLGIEMWTGYWPEFFMNQIDQFSFRLHGGVFTRGIWGLITLGEQPIRDHSSILLVNGIIVALILLMILAIYIWNIVDAYRCGCASRHESDGTLPAEREGTASKMFPYLVLLPMALLFLFVVIMPIIFAFCTAFTDYNRDHLPPGNLVSWVGFDNFLKLFNVPIWSKTFFSVLIWTIIWSLSVSLITYFVGMFQAVLMSHRGIKFGKLFQTIMILPWAIPQMISLLIFRNLLNGQFGPINQLLLDLGIITERIPFLTDPLLAKISVICVAVWLGFPMFMVMMLGVFGNMDSSLAEAAAIDGATERQIFWHIKFPQIFRATAPLLVMNIAGNFNGFGLIYFLTKGGPVNPSYQFAGDTDILISWIYSLTLDQQMYSMAAVMSVLIFIFIGAVSFWNFKHTTSFKEL